MLKYKVLCKKRTALQVQLKNARSRRKQLRAEEQELQQQLDALEEVTPELEQQIDENAEQITAVEDEVADLQDQIDELSEQITAIETEGAGDPAEEEPEQRSRRPAPDMRSAEAQGMRFSSRSRCFATRAARDAFFKANDSREFLANIRSIAGLQGASARRSVKGAELNIPETWLDLMRDNLGEYSKLIGLVRLRPVKGKARQNVVGKIPEGIWTEMRGVLNELDFAFNSIEVDGFKVGGFIPVDNCDLEDSDINLGEEIMTMLLASIGYALDKAIVYGLGPNSKMPVGIVTRLAQQSQPAYWGPDQGDWTDLHSANILKLNIAGVVGESFFQPLLASMGKAKPNYSDGKTFWCMNHATHMDLIGRGLCFNAAGALVAGLNDAMPVENGAIVELDFIPDHEIVGGYGSLYLLAEREGGTVAQSEHVKFIEDKTVFKGTARYDGQPVIGEGFVAINYANTDVTTAMTFGTDYANTAMNALICTAAAHGTTAGKTVVTVSGTLADSPELKYAVGYTGELKTGGKVGTAFADLTSGTTAITAAAGAVITVVELDDDDRIVSAGTVISVPKSA